MGYPNTIQYYRGDGQYVFPRTKADGLPVISGILGPNLDESYGPFVTIGRANQVVNILKSLGYSETIEYHNGDGQYVFPRTYLPPVGT
jgi:hypothetical protein